VWVFGIPTRPLDGFTQVRIAPGEDGTLAIHAGDGVRVELFGDAANMTVQSLSTLPE
jgi:hypothetical protein